MDREAEFNRTASDELTKEYERETGCRLSFKEGLATDAIEIKTLGRALLAEG